MTGIRQGVICAAFLVVAWPAAAQDDPEMCFMTAVTRMLTPPDGLIGAEACMAACEQDAECAAWNYKPHSFEPDTLPGDCRLLADVYQTDESDSYFCGRIER